MNLASSTEDVYVAVNNSKRAGVETDSGDDTVIVTIQNNDEGWSNTVNVNTNNGAYSIVILNSENTQFSMFSIDAGNGSDVIKYQ